MVIFERMSSVQPSTLITPLASTTTPSANTPLDAAETAIIPTLPITVKIPFNSEDAEPVSPYCCSRSRLELNGRISEPKNVNGANPIQNKSGMI